MVHTYKIMRLFFVEIFFVHNIFTDFFLEPVRRIKLCLLKYVCFWRDMRSSNLHYDALN